MPLTPTPAELLARARSDLRQGLAIVLSGEPPMVAVAAETLDAGRLADLRALGRPVLAITARRAETLKLRAYDGDLARIALPADADTELVAALADPSRDLAHPMKGPFPTLARLVRTAIAPVAGVRRFTRRR